MQAAYLALVYVAILTIGAAAPFALSLGYVWVDVFSPQLVASSLINNIPVSLIMAVAALGSYALADRRSPPPLSAVTVITLTLAAWVTLTTTWALVPDAAWTKWDWAFKNLLVSAFLPFVFRSRVQIEAFLLVIVLSLAAHFIPFGAKNLLSGGGYGRSFGLIAGNSGVAEGSTLAAMCVMIIPLMLWFKDHGAVLPKARWVAVMWWMLIAASVSATIATYERTGLIALAVLGVHVWVTSRRKLLVGCVLAGLVLAGAAFLAGSYLDRIATTGDYNNESSAFGRILVWRWTLGFVADHPLGGGFNVYMIDELTAPLSDGTSMTVRGKAFHSVYFEVLGEHGWPGIAMFGALLVLSVLYLQRARQAARSSPELAWCASLATQLTGCIVILAVGGLFISIALQPEFPYLFAAAVCLRAHLRRAQGPPAAARAWSDRHPRPAAAQIAAPASQALSRR